VIERDRGDRTGGWPIDDIRRIAAATETNLQDAKISRRLSKEVQGNRGDHLKHRNRRAVIHPLDMLECRCQHVIRNKRTGEPDALVKPHQMRGCVNVHTLSRCFSHRPQKSTRTAFAIRAGNVHNRWQAALWMIKAGKQCQ
jgi:hypothetical protein